MAPIRSLRVAHLATAAWLLAGCGITLPWDSTPPVEARAEFAPASLTFQGWIGGSAPAPQTIDVRVTPGWLSWGVGVGAGGDVLTITSVTELPDGWRRCEVTVGDPGVAGEGSHAAELVVFACVPPNCDPVPGAPWSIPVIYVVGPHPILAVPTAVAFEQVLGGTVAAPQVVSLTGPAEAGAWTSEIDFLGASPWFTVTPSSGTSFPADVQLQVTSPAATPERHVAATLRFTRAGVTAEVPVRLDEHPPAITTSTPELLFTAVQNQATLPPPQDVVLGTATGAASGFTLASTSAWWLWFPSSGTAPATVPVSVVAAWLAPGRYDGELIVHPAWATDAADDIAIAVHYDVLPAALAVSTDAISVSVTGDTTEAQLVTPVAITAAQPTLAWTAQPSDPWIVVDPPAGTGSGTLTVSVPKAAIPSLGQGGFMGVVTVGYVEPGYGPVTREIRVSLGIDLPWIASLQPRIGLAGASQPVSIWLAGTASSPVVLFGGTPALAVGPHPDAGLLFTPPPLPAGRWPVTVQNGLGLDWRPVALDLVAPTARVGAAVTSGGRKTGMVFDDASGMLWVANVGAGRVERYVEASGWTRAERAFAGLKDAALSPDGLQVVAVTERGLELVDSGVLDGPATVLPGFSPEEAALAWRLRVSSDGSGLVVPVDPGACQAFQPCGIHFLRLPDGQFVRHPFEDSSDGWSPAVPDDLSRVWILRHGAATPAPARYMLPWAGTISLMDSPMIFDGTALDLDRLGERALLLDVDPAFAATVGRLADTATGLLPGTLPPTTAAALLSQDGTRAIAFDGLSRTVRVFDLVAPLEAGTGRFAEVGTPGGFAPPADPGAAPVLALSVDERTLFLAGDDEVVVCPLP